MNASCNHLSILAADATPEADLSLLDEWGQMLGSAPPAYFAAASVLIVLLLGVAVFDARTLYLDREDDSLRWWMRPRAFSFRTDLWVTFCTRTMVMRIFFVFPGHTIYTRAQLAHVFASSLSLSFLMVCIFEGRTDEGCTGGVSLAAAGLATLVGSLLTTSGRLAFKAADLYGPARAIYRANKEVRRLALLQQADSARPDSVALSDAPSSPRSLPSSQGTTSGRHSSSEPSSPPPSPPPSDEEAPTMRELNASGCGEVDAGRACAGVRAAVRALEAPHARGQPSAPSGHWHAIMTRARRLLERSPRPGVAVPSRRAADTQRLVSPRPPAEGTKHAPSRLTTWLMASPLFPRRKREYGFRTRTLELKAGQLATRVTPPVIAYGFELPGRGDEAAAVFIPALRIGWASPRLFDRFLNVRRFTVRYAIRSLPEGMPLRQVNGDVVLSEELRGGGGGARSPPFALLFSPWLALAWAYNSLLLWGSYLWLLKVYRTRSMQMLDADDRWTLYNDAYQRGVIASFVASTFYSVFLVDACKVACLCLTTDPALRSFGVADVFDELGADARPSTSKSPAGRVLLLRLKQVARKAARRMHKLLDVLG